MPQQVEINETDPRPWNDPMEGDFEHPALEKGHPLLPLNIYRIQHY
ncbi:MAG: hypothetical protein OSB09_08090 [Planctomycetota bacterium]|nr:hypothetical protein [Planctomycetota bacterium]